MKQNMYLLFDNEISDICFLFNKGKVCCNCSMLASGKWMPLFMEQYANHWRLLSLFVPGKIRSHIYIYIYSF